MNSIISPLVFYLIGVADTIQILALLSSVVFVVISGFLWYDWLQTSARYGEIRKHKFVVKMSIVATVSLVILVFTPSSDTCYKMLAANMFTEENVTTATEYVTDVIDYAVDKVKELNPAAENERS